MATPAIYRKSPLNICFLDGVCFDMRIGKSIETVPVLVVIGVKKTGHKLVLGLQAGDKESASNWREFFKDLKTRGLNCQEVTFGYYGRVAGLGTWYLKKNFQMPKPSAAQVHVSKNVLAKVPRKFKKARGR